LGIEGLPTTLDGSAFRRALLVVAHMDDEINLCGLVQRLRQYRVDVDIAVLTDGAANRWTDASVVGARSHFECRTEELSASMRLLGMSEAVLPAFPDSRLMEHVASAAEVLRLELSRRAPTLVVTFDPRGLNSHPDHIATHLAVRGALSAGSTESALAMVVPPPPFSWLVGAGFRSATVPSLLTLTLSDAEVARKAAVFQVYRSQARTLRLLTAGVPPNTFFRWFRREWYVWLNGDEAARWCAT
jgi:LmbE family N-acetylglucosaminyl deacetylase